MFTKSTVSQSMIDAVNSILEEEKKIQQLDEASAFDWKANKNETDPKFTTKKPGERTGHESKKTATGTVYTKNPLRSDGQEFKKEETELDEKVLDTLSSTKHGNHTVTSKVLMHPDEKYYNTNTLIHKGTIKHKDDSLPSKFEAHIHINRGVDFQTKHSPEEKKAIIQHLNKHKQLTKHNKAMTEETEISFKDRLLALKNAQRQIQNESKTFDELLEDLNDAQVDKIIYEVLGKDADAGDYIHDFIHSKNPKFAGKSKEMRKKMALGAYYGKHNEEVKDEYARKVDKYLKKKYNKEEVEQIDEDMALFEAEQLFLESSPQEVVSTIQKIRKDVPKDAKEVHQHLDKAEEHFKSGNKMRGLFHATKFFLAARKYNMKEEVEQIDELSKGTLDSYMNKAKDRYIKHASSTSTFSPSANQKSVKYAKNILKAKEKGGKFSEEVEGVDEALIGGQKKIDKNHNGKIDAQDFQILRGQKKSQKNEGVMDVVKKVGGKVLKTLGHGSDEDMRKDLQRKVGVPQTGQKPKTEEAESSETFTDTLAGRVKGGKPNQHSSVKVKLKSESAEKPPFDPPYRTVKSKDHNVKDKSGAIHTPMSHAKHLAKMAMKKVKNEMIGKTGTSE
jgi:hypothetical protein